jgi:hypothetical protein
VCEQIDIPGLAVDDLRDVLERPIIGGDGHPFPLAAQSQLDNLLGPSDDSPAL